jgi:hypothetical protein
MVPRALITAAEIMLSSCSGEMVQTIEVCMVVGTFTILYERRPFLPSRGGLRDKGKKFFTIIYKKH